MRAGIVRGRRARRCRFRGEETTGKFNVESPHVVDSLYEATWLVEAHSPDPQLPRNASPLYIQLREDGLVSEHLNPSAGGDAPTGRRGGLNVSRCALPRHRRTRAAPARTCSRSGSRPSTRTGSPRSGSGKPGARSAFTRDARLIAEAVTRPAVRVRDPAQHDALHRRDRGGRLMEVRADAPAGAGASWRPCEASGCTCSRAARSSAACTT